MGILASAVILLAMIGGTGGAVFGMRQAQAEAQTASDIREVLEGILASVSPYDQGRDLTVREMLDTAARRLTTELADRPAIRAPLHRRLGLTYAALGVFESAEEQLKAAYDLRLDLLGDSSFECAESLADLGELANSRYDALRAKEYFEKCLAILRSRRETRRSLIAQSLHGLGVSSYTLGTFRTRGGKRYGLRDRDHYADAESAISESISILSEGGLDVPPYCFMNLGMALTRLGNYSAAERTFLKAIDASRRDYGEDSVSEALIRFEYAQLLEARCEFDTAERMFRESLDLIREMLGDRHPTLVTSLSRFADFLCHKRGNYKEAEKLYLEALQVRSTFADCKRFRGPYKYRRRLCVLYTLSGDSPKAIRQIQKYADAGLQHPKQVSLRYMNLAGDAYAAEQNFDAADPYYQGVISFAETKMSREGREYVPYARALCGKARVLAAREDLENAEYDARDSVDILRRILAPDDPRLADSLFVLGEILQARSKFDRAEAAFCECLKIRTDNFTEHHVLTITTQRRLDECLDSFSYFGASQPESKPLAPCPQGHSALPD